MTKAAIDILTASKKREMQSEVSILAFKLKQAEDLYNINSQILNFQTRIAGIRRLNYNVQSNLETDQIRVAELWASVKPSQKEQIQKEAAALQVEGLALYDQIGYEDDPHYFLSNGFMTKKLSAYKAKINDFNDRNQKSLASILSFLASIKRGLSTAETTLNLTSLSSFQWKADETPVFSFMTKDTNKKTEVLVTLTNQRFLCESMSRVALELADEHGFCLKPIIEAERRLLLEKPVSSVAKIAKGKLGLFAGEGINVEFKQSGDPKLKLKTDGEDADMAAQYFGMINSGRINDELKQNSQQPEAAEKRITSCSNCGAPYSDGVFHSQLRSSRFTKIPGGPTACKNCGTIISSASSLYRKLEKDVPNAWSVCPNCGTYISEDVEFCTCGAKLPGRVEHKCVVCGKNLLNLWGWKQCPEEHFCCIRHLTTTKCPLCGEHYTPLFV